MAVYKLFPIKDSSIYSFKPNMNTGLDAMLEINSLSPTVNPSPRVARSLIQFDQLEIDNVIDNIAETDIWDANLKTYIATANGIKQNSDLEAYPIYGEWNNGSGEYLDSPTTTDGVSWDYKEEENVSPWETSNFPTSVTASWVGDDNAGGGNWYFETNNPNINSIKSIQTFNTRTVKDLNLGVQGIVESWYSQSKNLDSGVTSIENQGFILKWEDSIEFNSSLNPSLKYYSIDTNTIYPPTLEIKWDDSSYDTTLEEISTPDVYISLDNNPGLFHQGSINVFRLNVRPEFPVRTFQTSSWYTKNHALPEESYYAIKDLDTDEFIVDFDLNSTKISCDNQSNYFTVYMNGLEPERYYKILIKTEIEGNTIIKDDEYYFKITN